MTAARVEGKSRDKPALAAVRSRHRHGQPGLPHNGTATVTLQNVPYEFNIFPVSTPPGCGFVLEARPGAGHLGNTRAIRVIISNRRNREGP